MNGERVMNDKLTPLVPTDSPTGVPDDEFEDDLRGDGDDTIERSGENAVRAPDWSVQILKSERSVFELHRQWRAGRLILDAEFQRAFIWKPVQQVRLIESVLAKIPLPAIYVAEESEDRTLVLDGQQRLTTLFRYMNNGFKLKGLELLPRYEGLRFGDLAPRMQRRIEDTALTVCSIQAGSDPDVKFYLFERLNQGGISLNAQEIRNGIHRGPGLELVQRLAAPGGPFRRVAGPGRRYARMKADELVLRAFAFLKLGPGNYPGDMQPFLNRALQELNGLDAPQRDALEARFLVILDAIEAAFGDDAFKRHDPTTRLPGSHLNAALMDVQLWGFHTWAAWRELHFDPEALVPLSARHRQAIRDRALALYEDPKFVTSITYATSITSRLRYRLRVWQEAMNDVA